MRLSAVPFSVRGVLRGCISFCKISTVIIHRHEGIHRVPHENAHLPAWVRRRDGSQVPFEADRICQSLYAAAETLGTPGAFLIRELTDVVLHFLAKDPLDAIPTTGQIVEHVEKIVREVGQPILARALCRVAKTARPYAGSLGDYCVR